MAGCIFLAVDPGSQIVIAHLDQQSTALWSASASGSLRYQAQVPIFISVLVPACHGDPEDTRLGNSLAVPVGILYIFICPVKLLIICKSRIIRIDFYTFLFPHNSERNYPQQSDSRLFPTSFPSGYSWPTEFLFIFASKPDFRIYYKPGWSFQKNRLHPQVVRLQQISVIIGSSV